MKNHKIELGQGGNLKFVDRNSDLNLLEKLTFTLIFAFVAMTVIVGIYTIFSSIIEKF